MAEPTASEQTNPAPAGGGTGAGVSTDQTASAPSTSTGSAAESPRTQAATRGGETTGTSTTSTTSGATPKGSPLPAGSFDPSQWNGEIDTAPEEVRELLRIVADVKGKQLEAGYTKKFQALADERKTFEDGKSTHDQRVNDLEAELRLYKALADGEPDPRIKDSEQKLSERDKQIATLTAERDELKQRHESFVKEQDARWLSDYKERHKDIFVDEGKKADLKALVDYGWEEEAAAELVGATDELKKLAEQVVRDNQLGLPQHKLAITLAKQQLGIAPASRQPRPAAQITSGAKGQVNPSRVPGGTLAVLPLNKAVQEAAKLAWGAGQKRPAAG